MSVKYYVGVRLTTSLKSRARYTVYAGSAEEARELTRRTYGSLVTVLWAIPAI